MMYKKSFKIFGMVLLVITIFAGLSSAAEITKTGEVTVCCEKTLSGLFCQDVPEEECAEGATIAPTACESTSFCRPGYCFDSVEGTCQDKTSQLVCNANDGIWRAEKPEQCELGCCVLGDQASFVTLTRCKRLSSFLGLQTNFKKNIDSEAECIASVAGQDKGACIYESELITTCKFTTREDCKGGFEIETEESGLFGLFETSSKTISNGEFYPGKLCSAEELGTNCAPTTETMCVPGKDEVYFKDSCGNPANVYDASLVDNKEYWTNVKDISESCDYGKANINSRDCGNCNYLLGSICRETKRGDVQPNQGDNICVDLNCYNTYNGNDYKHGESWCVYEDNGDEGFAVGARFFKHICINGEEVLEPCADYKQEICIQDVLITPDGEFSQSACRVNRWQDCSNQNSEGGCENTDKRDCKWIVGAGQLGLGQCVPLFSPGTRFWEGEEAKALCKDVDANCIIKYEEDLLDNIKYTGNEWCGSAVWKAAQENACDAIADCGSKGNWIGKGGGGYTFYNPAPEED